MSENTAESYLRWVETYPAKEARTEQQQEEIKSRYNSLPKTERYKVRRIGVESFFTPENIEDKIVCENSPSGQYTLQIRQCNTGPNGWNYSLGSVYRGDQLIAEIKRNYSSFPFLWVENHVSGTDLLICGEDYQGQTIIDLRTGAKRTEFSEEAEKGFGFCWIDMKLSPDQTKLMVMGCHWACPYEIAIFDCSDPMNKGLPEFMGSRIDSDENTEVTVDKDILTYKMYSRVFISTGEYEEDIDNRLYGLIRNKNKAIEAYEKEEAEAKLKEHELKYPCEEEDAHLWEKRLNYQVTARLENLKTTVLETWKSERWIRKEEKRKEYDEKWAADSRRYQNESEFYQWAKKELGYSNEEARDFLSFSLPSVKDVDNGEKNPAFFYLALQSHKKEIKRRSYLSWGVTDGEITLEKLKGTERVEITFPRTMAGFQQAFNEGKKWETES